MSNGDAILKLVAKLIVAQDATTDEVKRLRAEVLDLKERGRVLRVKLSGCRRKRGPK